jgi:hypothetical protein
VRVGRCVWPGCEDTARDDIPICEFHAEEAYLAVDRDVRLSSPKKPAHLQHGTVYYLRVGDRVKIGWSKNLRQRLASYPPGTKVLATEQGTRADEAAMHQRCTPWRVAGREWYAPCDGIDRVIQEAIERDRQREQREADERLERAKATPRPGYVPGAPVIHVGGRRGWRG